MFIHPILTIAVALLSASPVLAQQAEPDPKELFGSYLNSSGYKAYLEKIFNLGEFQVPATLTGATINAQFVSGGSRQAICDSHGGGRAWRHDLRRPDQSMCRLGSRIVSATAAPACFLNLTPNLGAATGLNGNEQNVAAGQSNFFNSGCTLPSAASCRRSA